MAYVAYSVAVLRLPDPRPLPTSQTKERPSGLVGEFVPHVSCRVPSLAFFGATPRLAGRRAFVTLEQLGRLTVTVTVIVTVHSSGQIDDVQYAVFARYLLCSIHRHN